MEKFIIFLQSLLVLFLAIYVTSSKTNCICQFPDDFCQPDITAVQGKVLGSKPVNENGQLVSDINDASKIRYRVNLTQIIIKGPIALHLDNNIFKIPVPSTNPCGFDFTIGSSHIFLGSVNSNERWNILSCTMPIASRGTGSGTGGGFNLIGDETTFSDLCDNI